MVKQVLVIKRFCRNYQGKVGEIIKCKISVVGIGGKSIEDPNTDVRYAARILTRNSNNILVFESATLDLDKGYFTKNNKKVNYKHEKEVVEKLKKAIAKSLK